MTIHFSRLWRFIILPGCAAILLGGCAQYQTATNKAADYNDRIERLFVWSAMGEVPLFRSKHFLATDSFENRFNAALKHALSEEGVVADVRMFSPKNDTFEQLSRFETDLAPAARLLIQPAKYRTFTYNGATSISELWIDMSLYDARTNQRVWRGQLHIDPGLGPNLFVLTSGAQEVSAQVIAALKKDKLIVPAQDLAARKQAVPVAAD